MRMFRDLLTLALVAMVSMGSPMVAFAATPGVSVDVQARLAGSFKGSNDLGTPVFPFDVVKLTQFSPGAASGLADLLFSDERTLAASATENLDLAGSLTSPLGSTLTFVKVKAIMIVAAAGNTNNVQVGGAASNGFTGPFADATDIVNIPPGGTLLLVHPTTGWTVTASTGDILKIANSGGTTGVTYKVVVIGATA
ncbi:MAG: hypothetical protein ACOYM5_02770 [Caulobacter sp.]